jgi:NAD(P)-dependent dehydrogenase (short-subunit alcohol dehydrogenase family)
MKKSTIIKNSPAYGRGAVRLLLHACLSMAFFFFPPGPLDAQPASRPKEGQMIALVTGSTSGLGREVARRLAARGAHVILHGRDIERGEALVAEIEEQGTGSARFYPADFNRLADVRELAESIKNDYDRLDLLVNNAGIAYSETGERELSADGNEMHLQVNYLSHFLLTEQLLPMIEKSAPARIVNVASGAQLPIDFDDVHLDNHYSVKRAYAQSKLAQVMFTKSLAERIQGTGVTTYSLHPATYMDTRMVRRADIEPLTTVEEGADAVMRLITADDLENGAYFSGRNRATPNSQAQDAQARKRLWDLSKELTRGH